MFAAWHMYMCWLPLSTQACHCIAITRGGGKGGQRTALSPFQATEKERKHVPEPGALPGALSVRWVVKYGHGARRRKMQDSLQRARAVSLLASSGRQSHKGPPLQRLDLLELFPMKRHTAQASCQCRNPDPWVIKHVLRFSGSKCAGSRL